MMYKPKKENKKLTISDIFVATLIFSVVLIGLILSGIFAFKEYKESKLPRDIVNITYTVLDKDHQCIHTFYYDTTYKMNRIKADETYKVELVCDQNNHKIESEDPSLYNTTKVGDKVDGYMIVVYNNDGSTFKTTYEIGEIPD